MNERIKELSKEAAIVYQKTLPPTTHTTPLYLLDKLGKNAKAGGIEIISDGFCEKFAELIVRECGVALSPMLRDMVSRGQAYDLIKKHFGVEE